MSTDTADKPRAGFLHRLHCARDGHYWERQLSDDGAQARWVCIRCGKQGETVPLVSAAATPADDVAAAFPDLVQPVDAEGDTGVMQPVEQDDRDEVVRDEAPEPELVPEAEAEPEPLVSLAEPVAEPEWEPVAEQPAAAPQLDHTPEPPATSPGPSLVVMAAVSLLVVGGVYLTFRRRRRRRHL
jgi:hypothetical protein